MGAGCQSHLGGQTPLGRGAVLAPMREIHELASPVNILVDLPGNRRDVRIPWPDCFIRVTVGAGSLNDAPHLPGSVKAFGHSSSREDRSPSVTGLASCRNQYNCHNNNRSNDYVSHN
jgi:hypothetical protein